MGIKLAIIGAGSTYCPELMQGLIRRKDKIQLDELRLSDIDESRLNIVGEFCERVLLENGMEPRITRTIDLPRALDGADFVVAGDKRTFADLLAPARPGRRLCTV